MSLVRTSLRELESLLAEQSVLVSRWLGGQQLQLVLQTGLVLTLQLDKRGNLARITQDKFLVGKLPEHVTGNNAFLIVITKLNTSSPDLVLTASCCCAAHLEPRLTLVTFGRLLDLGAGEMMAAAEPRLHHLDLHR